MLSLDSVVLAVLALLALLVRVVATVFDGSQDLDVNSSMAAEGRPLAAEAKWTSVLEGAQPFFLADRTAFLIRVRKDPLHRSRDMRFSHPQRSRRCFFDEQFSSPSFSEISSGSAFF